MSFVTKPVGLAMVLFFAALVYGGVIALSPLPMGVIDRDASGVVSFGEALDALDVGSRPRRGEDNCVEYFWLKDGSHAHEVCDQ